MKKFKKVAALLIAFAILFVTACGSEGTTPAAGGGNEGSAGETLMGEDFYGTFSSDVGTLNHLVTNKSVDSDVIGRLIDPLIYVDVFGEYQPDVATSWEQSEDGLTWTFHLREGVQWQRWDGSDYSAEVTAYDFVDAIEYILDKDLGSLTVDFVLEFIDGAEAYFDGEIPFEEVGVKALDKYTLQYTNPSPTLFFPSVVTYTCYLPINKQFVEEIGGIKNYGTDKDKILYYGEFLFQTWELDQEWTFVKNEKYFMADRIHIGLMNYVQVSEPAVTFEMFKRGEVSSHALNAANADIALSDPNLKDYVFRTTPSSSSWAYYFNYRGPSPDFQTAIRNTNFRKAFYHGLHRTAMLSVSNKYDPDYLKRNTINIWSMCIDEEGKDYMTYDRLEDITYVEEYDSYDPDLALEYMLKAKEELGSTVTWPIHFLLAVQNTESVILRSEAMKQGYEDIFGDLIVVDFFTYASTEYYKAQEEGAFDMTSGGWSPDYADPANYLDIYTCKGYMGARYDFDSVPEWHTYTDLIAKAKEQTTLAGRYEYLAQAECYAIIDEALLIPYQASGGNYALNTIQNPYQSLSSVPFGISNSKRLDMYYGKTMLTLEERNAQRDAFRAERDARAASK